MMQPVRRALLSLPLAAAVVVAGCGSAPTPQPSIGRPQLDPSGEPYSLPTGGDVDLPATWTLTPGTPSGPEVVRAVSGQGAIVVWQYTRSEPLPTTNRTLRNTRRSLRKAILTRDPSFDFTAALLRRVPEPAVEIAGVGSVAGAPRAIRSLHVYAAGRETVVDCIGPIGDRAQFDTTICGPVFDSLSISGS